MDFDLNFNFVLPETAARRLCTWWKMQLSRRKVTFTERTRINRKRKHNNASSYFFIIKGPCTVFRDSFLFIFNRD